MKTHREGLESPVLHTATKEPADAPIWARDEEPELIESLETLDLHVKPDPAHVPIGGQKVYRVTGMVSGSGQIIAPDGTYIFHAPNDYDANKQEKRSKRKEKRLKNKTHRKEKRDSKKSSMSTEGIHFQTFLGVEDGKLADVTIGSKISLKQFNTEEIVKTFQETLPDVQTKLVKGIKYAKEQGWDKMDYGAVANFSFFANFACLPDSNIAMDDYDFGNALWGAAMYCLNVPRVIARIGGHYNSVKSHQEFDTRADQKAIKMGFNWAKKNKIDRLVWP